MITSPIPIPIPASNSKRDLITEISALIFAHEMYIEELEKSAQNKKGIVPKRKEYRSSPLGRDMPSELDELSGCGLSELDHPDHTDQRDQSDQQIQQVQQSSSEGKFRKYKKNNEIAHHCQKLLKVTAYPSVAQITLLIHQIISSSSSGISNSNEIDSIRSIVLQWFRKRREYLASKVYSVCDEMMADVWMAVLLKAESAGCGPLSYDSTVEAIISDSPLMKGIFRASDLPIKDETNGVNFVKRKVKDYFTKLCSKIALK